MALLKSQTDYHMRHSNKEPEWSSICNTVFDEYLDTDDLFGLEANQHERCSSNDSINLFDFSGSSEQSHQTDATSPIPSWDLLVQGRVIEAQQPRAKEPLTFWAKTLRALEQNAAECEQKQQALRSTKSHADFLSLGGCPSPPAVPDSPTDQSFSAQRRVSKSAANGKRRNMTARSVSHGRPSGVTKTTVAGSANPLATSRRCSASPPKKMNPSRYRAGYKEVWADKLQSSPGKYALKVPSSAMPYSPPPSASHTNSFAAFGSPGVHPPLPTFDDQISPLTNTFQQAHIHTPGVSPALNSIAYSSNSNVNAAPPALPTPYQSQGLAANDTAPLYPERASSLAANKIQAFDFGFSTSPPAEPWNAGPIHEPLTTFTTDFSAHDPFAPLNTNVLASIATADVNLSGLGISCDPQLVSNFNPYPPPAATTSIPPPYQPTSATYSPPFPHPRAGIPRTPHDGHPGTKIRHRSLSPSPPATGPRSSKRTSSSSHRTSRHRRAKSTTATPRHPNPQSPHKTAGSGGGGFVNFTPQDSSKILNGVAPSGSSKTKARREKEAAEKRRRFSQAAVKAVVDAGGDVAVLDEVGLLV